jgi:hypothetical protein
MLTNKLILLSLFICITSYSFGQQRDVSGIVTDSSGEALIGVSVTVKGSKTGTVSDMDGKYSIKADDGQTLTFPM